MLLYIRGMALNYEPAVIPNHAWPDSTSALGHIIENMVNFLQVLKSCSPTASPSPNHLFKLRQRSSTKPGRRRETRTPGALYTPTSCFAPRDCRTCSWCQTVTSTTRRAPYRPLLPTTSTAGSSPLVSGRRD